MGKKIIRWLMSAVFFIIYFVIFDYTLGSLFPISPVSNMIVVFILVVINLPLSVFSTEKVFSIIEKK